MEIRYFLADKKSWSDVTAVVSPSLLTKAPKKGGVVNVGKIKMTVKDVVDSNIHGKPVTKVLLEGLTESESKLVDLVECLDNPTIIGVCEEINEAKFGGNAKMGGVLSDTRMQQSIYAPINGVGVFRPCTIELGNYVRTGLGSMGAGYGAQVADFGDAVSVTVTYSNAKTGRCASQSFVILWQPDRNPKYPFKVYANIARYRSCGGVDQAVGFIRNKASQLVSSTSSAI